ncbi:MAG: prolipoprotein diacylglyceryl transferase [Lachnospiraceae bacterium]|nr:prolipoprotein diacylglyceryl transferase [Lachnospiraceae bacterium]
MHNELITIGPVTIYGYGLMIGIGVFLAMIVGDKRAKGRGLNGELVYGLTVSAVVFGFLAAKVLFIITQWKDFIADPLAFISTSGFVVYGGLIGGIATAVIYCSIKKQNGIDYLDLMVPSVALAQGMGRIGCFLAGCCYGKPTDLPIGITFSHSAFAPNNVSLMPTQLIMSAGDFIIAAILLAFSRRYRKRGQVTLLWLILYSIGRFFIEFLRGDVARGSVGVLSTSQFIAVIMTPLCILLYIFAVPLLEKGRTAKQDNEEGSESEEGTDE